MQPRPNALVASHCRRDDATTSGRGGVVRGAVVSALAAESVRDSVNNRAIVLVGALCCVLATVRLPRAARRREAGFESRSAFRVSDDTA